MKQTPLISICIPTYNRSSQLSYLLDSIINQIDSRVEVVISDNGSTDSTLEMLTQYSKSYPTIKYQRQNENRGFVENYPAVGQMGSGEYLWFVGSDDEISPKGIETVLSFLEAEADIDGLLVNFRLCDNSLKDMKESFWSRLNQETEVLTDKRKAFIKYWGYAGFFSASVLRRDLWKKAVEELPLKEYPHFLHMLVSGTLLRNSKKWGFIRNECIQYRSGDADVLQGFGGTYLRIIKEVDETGKALRFLTQGDWRLTYGAEKVAIKLYLLPLLFANMQLGMPAFNRMRLVKNLAKIFWWHPYFWSVILPVLMLPSKVLVFARNSHPVFSFVKYIQRNLMKRYE